MYQVDICYFKITESGEHDHDDGEFMPLAWDMSYDEADEYAMAYAGMTLNLTNSLKLKGYDGCSIDIRKMADPEPHAYVSGYEFVPGRPLEVWM